MSEASLTKRVLFITPQPFFARRGSPFRVRATVNALSELGYEVDLLALPFGTEISIPRVKIERARRVPGISGVPIGPSWQKFFVDAFLASRALGLRLTRRYDVLHGIEEAGILATVLGAMSRTPHIFDMHSHMSEQLLHSGFLCDGWLLRRFAGIEAACMRHAAAIVTVGDDNTEKAKKIARHDRAFSLHDCPLDFSQCDDMARATALAEEAGIHLRRIALYTGNLEAYQGIDLLLQGFAEYKKQSGGDARGVVLVIIGGDGSHIGLLDKYRQMARDLGVAEDVVFTGERDPEVVGYFASMTTVFVSPRCEGTNTPHKIYTYMDSGRPIVATNILSHTQVLSDSNAFMADPDPISFGKALTQALEPGESGDRNRLARAAAAKDLADRKYSRECFKRTVDEIYKTALAHGGRRD